MSMIQDPLAKALQDAAEARVEGTGRILAALRGEGGVYAAQQAHRATQEDIARHRHRALAGARALIVNETKRLFGNAPLYARQDPGREHDQQERILAITKKLETEKDARAAMDRLLHRAYVGDNLVLAGGVAAYGLQKGWESVVGPWVNSRQLGGARGGWATVEKIKRAQTIVDGQVPGVLKDLPPLTEMAEQWGIKGRLSA